MRKTGLAVLAVSTILVAGFAAPASAEFFGCNDRTSVRNISSAPAAASHRASRVATHEYSAQSRKTVTYYRAGDASRATWYDRSR
jgi:hypothetical protein